MVSLLRKIKYCFLGGHCNISIHPKRVCPCTAVMGPIIVDEAGSSAGRAGSWAYGTVFYLISRRHGRSVQRLEIEVGINRNLRSGLRHRAFGGGDRKRGGNNDDRTDAAASQEKGYDKIS